MISLRSRILRRRGAVARRAGRRGRGGNSQLCRGLGDAPAEYFHLVAWRGLRGLGRGLLRVRGRGHGRGLGPGLGPGLGTGRWACHAVPEIAAVHRAARRDEEGIAVLASRDAAKLGMAGLGVAILDLTEVAREGAVDLVAVEQPATPRVRSRAAPGVGDAGGTRNQSRAVSWPISVGIGPLIWLLLRSLRRRGAVARRAGRRGRGGNSQQRQRRELADLGRKRAVDLVGAEEPATPRIRSRAAPGGDAEGTRRNFSSESWPISAGIGPSILFSSRYLRRRRAVARRAGRRGSGVTHSSSSAVSRPIVVGIGPVIPLLLRVLRRRGTVARRAGRRGRGGNSQARQRRELADLGRDPALDLVEAEVPATPRVGRAARRASRTRGEFAASAAPRAGRSRSGSGRQSGCRRGTCDAEGRSRGAPGVGDAGETRRTFNFVSRPIVVRIEPVILLPSRRLRRRGSVARRAGRRGRGRSSQGRERRELADLGRERAGDLVVLEAPATPRGGRAPRRASGTRGELATSREP